MIEIVNVGETNNGKHNYVLRINPYGLNANHRLICRFSHSREEGLAECLRRAADAIDERMREEGIGKEEKIPPLR